MSGGPMRKFNLNGPSNDSISRAVTGAVNSTALEWSFSGDDVIYDVFNSLAGAGGATLTNWDIGFLRGWDPDQNSYGDGEVSKLFNNLGDGISVGNPTFSKNSPNIIAYEMLDDMSYSVSVVTMNMENRKTVTVATTAFPGYPSYSKRDDRISFSNINGTDTVISVVKVKADKQTVDGTPAIAIRKMKWAVFFASGTRESTKSRQSPATQPAVARQFGLTVLSCADGVRARIVGAENTPIRISIFRADGKMVHQTTLQSGAGPCMYTWNSAGTSGTTGSGVYLIRAQSSRGAAAKKFCMVR
jgi:hypothetical protein